MYNIINTLKFTPYLLSISSIVNDAMSALLNLVMKICLSIVDFILIFISGIGANTNILETIAPDTMKTLYSDIFIPLGWGIAIMLLMSGIFQFFFPFLNRNSLPADSILMLIVRFVISLVLILFLKDLITDYIQPIVSATVNSVMKIDTSQISLSNSNYTIDLNNDNSNNVTLFDYSDKDAPGILQGLTIFAAFLTDAKGTLIVSAVALFVIILVLSIYLCVVCVKFLIYHIELLVQTSLWVTAAPTIAGTYTSKQTSNMLFMWLKMLLKNYTCIVFNIITLKIAEAVCSVYTKETETLDNRYYYLVLFIPILCAILNVGKKISINIGQLFGINGMGDSIRDGLGGLAGTAMSLGGLAVAGGRAMKSNNLHKQSMERMERNETRQAENAQRMSEKEAENNARMQQQQAQREQDKNNAFDTLKHNKDNETLGKIDDLKDKGYSPKAVQDELKARGDLQNAIDDKDYKSLSKADQDMIDSMAAKGNDDFFDAYNEAKKDEGMSASQAMEFAKTGLKADDFDDYKAAMKNGMNSNEAADFINAGLKSDDLKDYSEVVKGGMNSQQATEFLSSGMGEGSVNSFNEARKGGMSVNDAIQTAKTVDDVSKINPNRSPQLNASTFMSARQNAIDKGISPQGATQIAQNRIYNSAQSSPAGIETTRNNTYNQAYNKAISLGKSEETAKKFAEMKTKNI